MIQLAHSKLNATEELSAIFNSASVRPLIQNQRSVIHGVGLITLIREAKRFSRRKYNVLPVDCATSENPDKIVLSN